MSFKAEEFEIVELLSRDYGIKDVCAIMGVSRAGYYKWKKRGKSTRAIDREKLLADVKRIHEEHPSHGYRWVAAYLRINEKGTACDNMVYKCFRYLNISSQTLHRVKRKPRKIKDRYPNLIFSTWDIPNKISQKYPTHYPKNIQYITPKTSNHLQMSLIFSIFAQNIITWNIYPELQTSFCTFY